MGKSDIAGEGGANLGAECMHTYELRVSIKLDIISIAPINLGLNKVQSWPFRTVPMLYLWAICELQYCCGIQEGSILFKDVGVYYISCSEKQKACRRMRC